MTIGGAAARFCERFEVELPIANAPMAFVAGGRLAAAVAGAGGLGLIGGGYGDIAWIDEQRALGHHASVGVGVITWALADQPRLLHHLVDRGFRTVMLSFGDPDIHVARLRRAGVRVLCQVQTVEDGVRAADAGVDAIVAQGSESGGHGSGTTTLGQLLPAVVTAVGSLPVRALANELTRRWEGGETEIRGNVEVHRAHYAQAVRGGDLQERVVWAGTGVSGVHRIDVAATVMSDLAAGLR